MEIRQLPANEYDKALDLSLDVFIECGRKDFDEEGLETFKNFIYNKQLVNELTFYGAFDGESLIGVIATKNEGKQERFCRDYQERFPSADGGVTLTYRPLYILVVKR